MIIANSPITMSYSHRFTLKKVAFLCYFLFINLSSSFTQSFNYMFTKDYITPFSVIDYDIYPIFNIKRTMGVSYRLTDNDSLTKVFFIGNNGIIYKEIPLITDLRYYFSAYDTNLIVFLSDLRNNPILLFKSNIDGNFVLKTKLTLLFKKKF